VNIYTTKFFSVCPSNGIRVKYTLKISSEEVIPVEQIVSQVEAAEGRQVFHEEHADIFAAQLPGEHVLRAHHHGVDIATYRASSIDAARGSK
jgi:hypothetical protein